MRSAKQLAHTLEASDRLGEVGVTDDHVPGMSASFSKEKFTIVQRCLVLGTCIL